MDSFSMYRSGYTFTYRTHPTNQPQISTDAKFFHQLDLLRILFIVFNNT